MLRIKLTLLTLISACATVSNSDVILLDSKPINAKSEKIVENQLNETSIDIWERIRRELTIKIPDDQIAATSIYRERLYKNQSAVNRISKSGQRYLFHTLSRAQELDLPVELALLPFVESEFDPYAKSVDGQLAFGNSCQQQVKNGDLKAIGGMTVKKMFWLLLKRPLNSYHTYIKNLMKIGFCHGSL